VAADLAALQSNHDIYHIQFTSHRKFIGPLVMFVKKVVRQLLTPSLVRQSEYNGLNNRLTLRLWQQVEGLQKVARELDAQLQGVRQEVAEQLGGMHLEQGAALQALRRDLVEQLGGMHQRQVTGLQAVRGELAEQLASVRHEQVDALQVLRERTARTEGKLRRFLDSVPDRQAADGQDLENSTSKASLPLPKSQESVLDYVGFEERCRGSEETIKQRQKIYVDYFKGANDILDIGCGRGEFLELLAMTGIKAKGVDLDLDMVLYCQDKGLDVINDDAFAYLDALPDESLGGIFAAQVIEHLEAGHIIKLIKLCQQKLQPGGTLIIETPNPTCLAIFARRVYMNFAPIKPLHPEAAKFLFESAGFNHIEVNFSAPIEPYMRIPPLHVADTVPQVAEEFNNGIERLNDLLYGFQDYAVIGRKSAH
jgi:O-antigen chain-terminating methyltransferase